jgi:hypothetical protein
MRFGAVMVRKIDLNDQNRIMLLRPARGGMMMASGLWGEK